MKKMFIPKGRTENIAVQNLHDEVLIYDLSTDQAFCLNETSAFVWQMCDGNNSVTAIAEALSRKLNLEINEDFVWFAINELERNNLLANGAELPAHFENLNRRETIKRVGFACAAALPVISWLVAPPAISAASGGCVNIGGQAPNTTVRTTPNGFAGCYADCSSPTVSARCCSNSARATSIVCDPGPPQRTSCLCN